MMENEIKIKIREELNIDKLMTIWRSLGEPEFFKIEIPDPNIYLSFKSLFDKPRGGMNTFGFYKFQVNMGWFKFECEVWDTKDLIDFTLDK